MERRLFMFFILFLATVASVGARADDSAWVVPGTEIRPAPPDGLNTPDALDCQLWRPLRNLQWYNSIQDICWRPGTDRLWAVGGFSYGPNGIVTEDGDPIVCRSVDGGYHWEIDQPNFGSDAITSANVTLYTVRFVSEQVGFAAGGAVAPGQYGPTTAVVYRTTDSGLSWELVYEGALGPNYPRHVIGDMVFTDELNGWATGAINQYDSLAIIHTSDGGDTWIPQMSGIDAAVTQVDFVDSSTGYCVGTLGYTLKTTNGGSLWTIASESGHYYYGAKGLEFLSSSVGVGLNSGPLVLRTVDGGSNWVVAYDPPRPLFALDFVDANVGWAVGDIGTTVRTLDGGVSWEQVVSPPNIPSLFGCAAKDADAAWMCGGGTIGYTTDAGATWRHIDGDGYITSATLYDVDFVDEFEGWGVGYQGELVHTTDRGTTWNHEFGVTVNIMAVDFASPTHGWLAGGKSVWHTGDGGQSWNQQAEFGGSLIDVQFRNDNLGWVSGIIGAVYRTSNGGVTWDSLSTGTTEAIYAMSFVSDSIGWAVGWNGTILRTDDGGDNWQPQAAPDSTPLYSVRFVDNLHGWIAAGKEIYGTNDGGQTWQTQHTQMVNNITAIDFFDANNGIAVGGRVGVSQIMITDDGGATWTDCGPNQNGQSLGIGQKLHGVVVVDGDLAYAAGVEGWIVQIGHRPTGIADPVPAFPPVLEVFPASPNPFSDGTRIPFWITARSDVVVDIFDVAGRRVFHRRLENLPAGDNTFFFDGSSQGSSPLPSGIYFQRLTALGVQRSQKLVIIR